MGHGIPGESPAGHTILALLTLDACLLLPLRVEERPDVRPGDISDALPPKGREDVVREGAIVVAKGRGGHLGLAAVREKAGHVLLERDPWVHGWPRGLSRRELRLGERFLGRALGRVHLHDTTALDSGVHDPGTAAFCHTAHGTPP